MSDSEKDAGADASVRDREAVSVERSPAPGGEASSPADGAPLDTGHDPADSGLGGDASRAKEGSDKESASKDPKEENEKESLESSGKINGKSPPPETKGTSETGAQSGEQSTPSSGGAGNGEVKTESGLTPLEKAQRAADNAKIAMLPELDPPEPPAPGSGLPKHQHKYALSAIRAIKRLKDAQPFVAPVDPVKQGVPQYFDYIKHPMDLGTMEKQLVANSYDTVAQLVDDFNLIVSNCIIFNGEEALISKMALSIAQSFKKQLSNMPTFDASKKGSQAVAAAAAASASHASTPTTATTDSHAVEDHDDGSHVGKRSSTTTTVVGPNGVTLRRKSTIDGRPKREIRPPRHPGASSFVGSGTGEGRPRNKKYASELRFAGQVLREMQSRKLESIAFPFLQPVDPVEQGVPTYFDVIKEPMDLSTMQKKLTEGIYYTGDEFEADVRLMFRNCYTFNPEGTPVNAMGHKLEEYFDQRWLEKPVPGSQGQEDSDVSDVDDEYADSGIANRAIEVLEDQVRLMKKQLRALKKEALADYYRRGNRRSAGAHSTSAPKRRRLSAATESSSSSSSRPVPTEMTYEMKRELRDRIDKLPEKKIRTVLAIIQESMPDLGSGGQDEIELEVDQLDQQTLLRLYTYAVLGRRDDSSSGSAAPEDAASPHLQKKRKSKPLSEEEHNRQIAEIESKLKEFDKASHGGRASLSSFDGSSVANGLSQAAGSVTGAPVVETESSDDEQFDSDSSSEEE